MSEPQAFLDGKVVLHAGDSLHVLKELPDCSIDSVVTDPPYALVSIQRRFGKPGAAPAKAGTDGLYARASAGFMGKAWDTGERAFAVEFWLQVWRVLKPGGHLVAFSGTRTYHRMVVAIEDAGFEIRDQLKFDHAGEHDAFVASLSDEQRRQFLKLFVEDDTLGQLAWAYGSGFPKSHDVSKAIDKSLGAEREKVRKPDAPAYQRQVGNHRPWMDDPDHKVDSDVPVSPEATDWQGWGTALKPAWEPVVLARKPLDGTVAENVLEHGTGGLNVDGCRVGSDTRSRSTGQQISANGSMAGGNYAREVVGTVEGRWPANIVHDGSDEVVSAFPESDSGSVRSPAVHTPGSVWGIGGERLALPGGPQHGDAGSAARFFYSAKADAHDRIGSKHPTVKPVDLMQWLVRLVTPKGGVVLDPFAGTGTTGEAAWREGMRAVLIEREDEYRADIARRMRLAERPAERAAVAAAKGVTADASGLPLFGGGDAAPSPAGGDGSSTGASGTTDRPGRIEAVMP